MERSPLLRITNLTKRFGGIVAVDDCTVHIKEKTIVGLIGPNGAGKTTLINLINGLYKPDAGEIRFNDERIDGLGAHEIAHKGIGRSFQLNKVFRRMTTTDNLIVPGLSIYKDRDALRERAMELLKFFLLDKLKDEYAGNLSGGQQKLLDMARALISDPALVLLDEPFHGVHPNLKEKICENIRLMNEDQGKTFIVVSHDIPSIMSICERIVVLNAGILIADGTPDKIRRDEKVMEAYLGV
ncbi:MAG: ABC transporter ATP-binding protein [Candidatus Geothermarchaeales archaeon]